MIQTTTPVKGCLANSLQRLSAQEAVGAYRFTGGKSVQAPS